MFSNVAELRRSFRRLLHLPVVRYLLPVVRPLARVYVKRIKDGMVIDRINGVVFELDLGELIDHSLYWKGYFEKATHERLRSLCQPGWHVLDIGANIGAHALFIAKAVGHRGRVDCFEPATYAYRKLVRNAELNDLPQLRVWHLGLSDHEGRDIEVEIGASWPLDKTKATGSAAIPNVRMMKDRIDLVRLDDHVAEHGPERIDLIKIDIDGNEVRMMRGAMKTLERFRPIILFEAIDRPLRANGSSLEEYLGMLESLGYHFYYEDSLMPLDEAARTELTRNPDYGLNLLALQNHEDHHSVFRKLKPVRGE